MSSNIPNRQQPFRLTPQVGIIVMIAMAALVLPLAGVILLLRDSVLSIKEPVPAAPAEAPPAPDQTLQRALENVADSVLKPEANLLPRPKIEIIAASKDEQSELRTRLAALVTQANGFVVDVSTAESPDEAWFFVTIPASWVPDFEKAMRGGLHTPAPVAGESSTAETSVIEVRLKRRPAE